MNLIESINIENINIQQNVNEIEYDNEIENNLVNYNNNDNINNNIEGTFKEKILKTFIFYIFVFSISLIFLITTRNLVKKNNQILHKQKLRILEEHQNKIDLNFLKVKI